MKKRNTPLPHKSSPVTRKTHAGVKNQRNKSSSKALSSSKGLLDQIRGTLLYGQHAVAAALANPDRHFHRLHVNERGKKWLDNRSDDAQGIPLDYPSPLLKAMDVQDIPHQGIAAEVAPLLNLDTGSLNTNDQQLLLVLDQVSDPQNLGNCIRSAAAFGVSTLITQDRHSPGESGALAKAASGMLENINWARANNIAKTLEELKQAGFWIIGLDGSTEEDLSSTSTLLRDLCRHPMVIVMGSEGKGIRPLVARNCDALFRIPMAQGVESLNVSTATAITLFTISDIKRDLQDKT